MSSSLFAFLVVSTAGAQSAPDTGPTKGGGFDATPSVGEARTSLQSAIHEMGVAASWVARFRVHDCQIIEVAGPYPHTLCELEAREVFKGPLRWDAEPRLRTYGVRVGNGTVVVAGRQFVPPELDSVGFLVGPDANGVFDLAQPDFSFIFRQGQGAIGTYGYVTSDSGRRLSFEDVLAEMRSEL